MNRRQRKILDIVGEGGRYSDEAILSALPVPLSKLIASLSAASGARPDRSCPGSIETDAEASSFSARAFVHEDPSGVPETRSVALTFEEFSYYRTCLEHHRVKRAALADEIGDAIDVGDRKKICQFLIEAMVSLAPVVVFLDQDCYTSEKYWGNNLLGDRSQPGLLRQLESLPPEAWTDSQRELIFGLWLLLETGGPYRLEEMNWHQIDAVSLVNNLRATVVELRTLAGLGTEDAEPVVRMGVSDLISAIEQLRNENQSGFSFYRQINGLTLNKKRLLLTSDDSLSQATFDRLLSFVKRRCPQYDEHASFESIGSAAEESSAAEEVLFAIAQFGLLECRSSFFMTRGSCNWIYSAENEPLKKSDFYCLVVASEARNQIIESTKYSLAEMAWNQSKRMQFNGWKFWYGNLDVSERMPNQYWFHPPALPDIAYSEDTRYAGHARNGVVQSIRCPGSLELPVTGSGRRKFEGVYDIRAARSYVYPRYGQAELLVSLGIQRAVGEFLAGIISSAASRSQTARVNFFDREFHLEWSVQP